MRAVSPFLAVAAMALLLSAARVRAQEELVTLQNGAVFQGRITTETEGFLELEVKKGRIRIYKRWMQERRPILAPASAPAPGPRRSGPSRPSAVGPKPPAPKPPDITDALRAGASLLQPLGRRITEFSTGTPSEDVALAFCRLAQEGRGAEALEQLADPEAVLANAFPVSSNGLTAYSRQLGGRHLMRWLGHVLGQPANLALLRVARVTGQIVPGAPGRDTVEILLHTGSEEPHHAEIGVSRGRIVMLSLGPPPLPAAFQEIASRMKQAGDKSWSLVPVLEQLLLQAPSDLSSPDPDALTDHGAHRVWTLRPRSKGYTITLPWAFEPVREDPEGLALDVFVHAPKENVAALVRTERLILPPAELKRSFCDNLAQAGASATVESERQVKIGDAPALRLHVEATYLGQALAYEVLLFVSGGRTYQAAVWCEASQFADRTELVEAVLKGLRVGP